jgi:hypothetical protein
MRQIFYNVTGGRPMRRLNRSFTDRVSGKRVEYFEDKFGRKWMADGGPWSLFRVPAGRR